MVVEARFINQKKIQVIMKTKLLNYYNYIISLNASEPGEFNFYY